MALFVMACNPASAVPITYDVSVQLYNGTVTGSFTYDAALNQVSDYLFTIDDPLLPYPVTPPSGYTLDPTNSYVQFFTFPLQQPPTYADEDDTIFQFQTPTAPDQTLFNLVVRPGFDAIGPNGTSLLQYHAGGPTFNDGFFQGTLTAETAATPLPASLWLFAGGLFMLGVAGRGNKPRVRWA